MGTSSTCLGLWLGELNLEQAEIKKIMLMAQDLEPKALDQEELAFRTKLLIAQSCQTLGNPMDCSPPGSSVHGILQARILEWVAISVSRGSSHPRDQTQVSCIAGRFFIS